MGEKEEGLIQLDHKAPKVQASGYSQQQLQLDGGVISGFSYTFPDYVPDIVRKTLEKLGPINVNQTSPEGAKFYSLRMLEDGSYYEGEWLNG